ERVSARTGRAAALTGLALDLGLTMFYPETAAFACLTSLAVMAVLIYRRWLLLWPVYAGVALLGTRAGVQLNWQIILALGVAQFALDAEISLALRPRRFRTLYQAVITERDWATPLFAVGGLCIALAILRTRTSAEGLIAAFALEAFFALYSIRLRW